MSSWRWGKDGPTPDNFFSALMGDEEGEEYEEIYIKQEAYDYSDNELEDIGDRSPSPVHPRRGSPVERPRSRSPLGRMESGLDPHAPPLDVVLYVMDENGKFKKSSDQETDGETQEEFWEADAHALYETNDDCGDESDRIDTGYRDERDRMDAGDQDDSNSMTACDRHERERHGSVRGRVRGRRRGRASRSGHSRAPGARGGRHLRDQQWNVGKPLTEIWLHDEDVPSNVREMVMDIVRKREARAQEMRERSLRRRRQEHGRENEGDESESEDEFHDATDGRGNPLFLESEALRFEWLPMDTFQGQEEFFMPERTGSVESYSTAYDAFRSYWDDYILQFIVDETNRYAEKVSSAAFQREWFPTNSHEVLCLFAFWIMLGIIRMPTITSCFSLDPLLKVEVFRRIFSKRRYHLLTRALNFVDTDSVDANSTNGDPAASSDRLYRLRPILDHLNAKFRENYIPSQNICLDESLTPWKGSLDIKQYIGSKAGKFGIKSFELCESATGYLWSFIFYTGKHANPDLPHDPLVLKSTAVVRKLVSPLLNKGYRLFMDNCYNSPLLARFLKRNGTDCVGTLHPNRSHVPDLVTQAPLKQGQLIARHSGDICVLSWQDRKRVNMISTCHGSHTAWSAVPSKNLSRPLPFMPQVVLDYNKWMGGVDLKDHMLEPYMLERKKCSKWYMKLFKRLLNCSILNSRILLESSSKRHHHHLSFRLHLVDAILTNHLHHISRSSRPHQQFSRPNPCRFMGNNTHWLVRNPQSAIDHSRNRQTRLNCSVCLREGRKNNKTPYRCVACDVPLCVENCFKTYHS